MEKTNYKRVCKLHKSDQSLMLQFTDKCEFHEICIECLQQFSILPTEFLSIQKIINSNEQTIFKHFPPLDDCEIQNQLNIMAVEVDAIDQLTSKIKNYITDFKQQFDQQMAKLESSMKLKIIALNDIKQEVIKQYNVISSKNQIKELFTNNSNEIDVSFKAISKEKQKSKKENTEIIRKPLMEYVELSAFDIDEPLQIKNKILKNIEEINFFQCFEIQIDELTKKQKRDETEILKDNMKIIRSQKDNTFNNDETLFDLISSKTNYCSTEYLDKVKQMLHSCKSILNKSQVCEKAYNKELRDSFQLLNEEQLENMRVLSSKVQEISSQYNTILNEDKNNQVLSEIQSNSYNILQTSSLIQPYQQQVAQLLQDYPIFECIKMPISLINSVEFIKSQHGSSSTQQIERQQEKYIQIIQNQQGDCISYTNFILNPNKKYIFKVNIASNPNSTDTFILFGLITDQDKDNSLYNQKMSYCEKNDECGMSKMIKGNKLHMGNNSNINSNFEMRIHLKEKILKIGEYPKYENVCELDDSNKISDIQQYRFATQMCYVGDRITIQDIYEVDDFNDKM